ncbi:MAG: hypothetical protein ACI37R_05905 [Candidatus Avigastranaerophilus sp.]
MDRRELLKSGLLVAGAAAVGLTGCSKNIPEGNNHDYDTEMPVQKEKFEISTPLPFNYDIIDEMEAMNNLYKKSKITTVYNNMPLPFAGEFNGFFACQRGVNNDIKSYADFGKYVKYAQEKGFEFIYLLNSPKAFSARDFRFRAKKFYELLDFLNDYGCKNIKVGNTQVATLINEYKHKFDLYASTAFEFHNTLQYINLVKNYPNIKGFDLAIDENRNFPFMRNMHKLFPDKKLEVITQEPCIMGCPARVSHDSSDFKFFDCSKVRDNIVDICKPNKIYPWTLAYYQDAGIRSFKMTAWPLRANITYTYFLRNYLDCVEYDVNKSNMSFQFFLNQIFLMASRYSDDVKLKDVMPYLPDIKRFIKNGDKCASQCGVECTYCDECAAKIKKIMGEK